jgi:hypothetical protein
MVPQSAVDKELEALFTLTPGALEHARGVIAVAHSRSMTEWAQRRLRVIEDKRANPRKPYVTAEWCYPA